MAAAKTVPVHPTTLRLMREDIGLSVERAADKLKVPVETVEAWEAGETGIGLSNARKLADHYKVSLPVLYVRNIPEEWRQETPKDFRRPGNRRPYSLQLCYAIREARDRQTWMREYLQDEHEAPLDWLNRFSGRTDAKEVAGWVVQWLEMNRREIEDAENDEVALSYWREKVEAKRISVSTNRTHAAYKISCDEYSGLALHDGYAPFILLNPADSHARRIFTLVHEVAHLLLDTRSGVSHISFRQQTPDHDPLETMCNRVASEVLIHDDVVRSAWEQGGDPEDIIHGLAARLKVSHSAIAVKAKVLHYLDQATLDALLARYQQRALEHGTPKRGRTIPDKSALDRCGRLLARTVLTAYEQGSVNATAIYDVLGLKLKYLDKLSRRMQFPLHRWTP